MDTRQATRTPLDHEMMHVAMRRGIVRLRDGQCYTLIRWGKNPDTRNGSHNQIRVEKPDGRTRFTAKKTDVLEVVDRAVNDGGN